MHWSWSLASESMTQDSPRFSLQFHSEELCAVPTVLILWVTLFYGSLHAEVFEYLHEHFKRELCCMPSSYSKLLDLCWRGSYWVILNTPYLLLYCEQADFLAFPLFSNFPVQYLWYGNSNHFSNSLTFTCWKLIFPFAKSFGTPIELKKIDNIKSLSD